MFSALWRLVVLWKVLDALAQQPWEGANRCDVGDLIQRQQQRLLQSAGRGADREVDRTGA
jgi:hypothetical protein